MEIFRTDEIVTPFSTNRAENDDRPCDTCTRNIYLNMMQAVMGATDAPRQTCPVHSPPTPPDAAAAMGGDSGMRSGSGPGVGATRNMAGGQQQYNPTGAAIPTTHTSHGEISEIQLEANYRARIRTFSAELAQLSSLTNSQSFEGHQAALRAELAVLEVSLSNLAESRRNAPAGRRVPALPLLNPISMAMMAAMSIRNPTGPTEQTAEPAEVGRIRQMAGSATMYRNVRDPEAGLVDAPPAYVSVLGEGSVEGGASGYRVAGASAGPIMGQATQQRDPVAGAGSQVDVVRDRSDATDAGLASGGARTKQARPGN